MDGRPGTMLVAGALKVLAVFVAAGAIVGVALFRAQLLTLVPFVGATGIAPPAIFAALVLGIALLFWAMADALVMLAAHLDAHELLESAIEKLPARSAPGGAAPKSDKSAGVGDVPGFSRYQRPLPRVLKWTANVTNGPALLANAVCEVTKGDAVTAIGEVKEFAFVETAAGNGWLPKDSLAERPAA